MSAGERGGRGGEGCAAAGGGEGEEEAPILLPVISPAELVFPEGGEWAGFPGYWYGQRVPKNEDTEVSVMCN